MEGVTIYEGFLRQLTKSVEDDLPEQLKKHIEGFEDFDLELEIQEYLQENAIEVTDTNYSVIRKIDSQSYDALKKRKKYTMEKLAAADEKDYQQVKQGKFVSEVKSPFSKAHLHMMKRDKSSVSPEEEIHEKIQAYYEKALAKESFAFKTGLEHFVGISDHPYFDLYEAYPQLSKEGIKYLKLDLEETIVRLLLQQKYKSFVSYTPEILGKGFFGSKAPKKKGAAKDDEEFLRNSSFALKENVLSSSEKALAKDVSLFVKFDHVLDEKDMEIIDFIYSDALRVARNEPGRVHYKGNFQDICRILWPEKKVYAGKNYDIVRERLKNVFNTSVESSNKKVYHSIKFFYDADIEGTCFFVDLGKRFFSQALTNRIQPVLNPVRDSLDNDAAKVIYARLKADRIEQLLVQHGNTTIYYVEELNMMYHLEGRTKKEKIRIFTEAIESMRDKGVLVSALNVINDCFEVTWTEFSPEENADIRQIKMPRPVLKAPDVSDDDIVKELELAASKETT